MSSNPLGSLPSVDDMLGAIEAQRERIESDEELRKELTEGHPSGNPITLGPRLPSPEEHTALQVKGVRDNAQKWFDRVTKPKKNFKEEALKETSKARFHDSMETVLREKRWEGGMELVNESEAIDVIKAIGPTGYSKAVEARKSKILRVNKELHDDRLALAVAIDDLPVATDADREAKMIANKRGLQAIGKKRRGG